MKDILLNRVCGRIESGKDFVSLETPVRFFKASNILPATINSLIGQMIFPFLT